MGTIPTLLVVAIVIGLVRGVLTENRTRRRDPGALRYPHASRYVIAHSVLLVCAGAFTIRAVLWDWLHSPASILLAVAFALGTLMVGQAQTRAEIAHRR